MAFNNSQDFLNFCAQIKVVPVWEDTLKPFSSTPRKKNILLIQNTTYLAMKENLHKSKGTIQVEESDTFDSHLSIFSGNLSANVIAFDNNSE